MKKMILLAMVLTLALVSLGGCYWPYHHHDRGDRYDHRDRHDNHHRSDRGHRR